MNKTKLKYVKYTKQELDRYVRDKNSCITLTNSEMHIGFPPWGFANFQETLTNIISREKIGKYDPKLDGIVLEVRNIKVFGTAYPVHDDDPVNHINIKANFYVFQPRIGAVVKGVVKHISHGHVAVIIYRVFNVSIRFNRSTVRGSLEMNQQISFRIKKFDLHGAMPYIEGELIESSTKVKTEATPKRLKFDDDDEVIGNGGDSGISTEENDRRPSKNVKAEQDNSSSRSSSSDEDDSSSNSSSDSDSHNSSNGRLANGLFANVKIKEEKLSDSEINAQKARNPINSRDDSSESTSEDDDDSRPSTSVTKIKKEPSRSILKVKVKQEKKSSGSSSSSSSSSGSESEEGANSNSSSVSSSDSSDDETTKTPIPLDKIKKEKGVSNGTVLKTFIPRPIKVEPESDIEGKSKFKKPTTDRRSSQKLETPVKSLKRKRESSISEHLDSLVDDLMNAPNSNKKRKKSNQDETLGDLSTTLFQSPALSSTLKPTSKSKQKSKSSHEKLDDSTLTPLSKIKQEPQSEDESAKRKKSKKSLTSIQDDLFSKFLK